MPPIETPREHAAAPVAEHELAILNEIGVILSSTLELRDAFACVVDRLFGFPAERVIAARGIAELGREKRHHRIDHPRIAGSRRVIVHINRQLDSHVPILLMQLLSPQSHEHLLLWFVTHLRNGDGV